MNLAILVVILSLFFYVFSEDPFDDYNVLGDSLKLGVLKVDKESPEGEVSNNIGPLSVIILGASGDLAKRKTFPSLWALYREGLLPTDTRIFGVARAKYTDDEFRVFLSQNIKTKDTETAKKLETFKSLCYYQSTPSYSSLDDFKQITTTLEKLEPSGGSNRLFYLALPPSLFVETSTAIRSESLSKGGWNRIIVEKPFGHDSESSSELSLRLSELFSESEIFRIDHYLGKEMLINLIWLRFGNILFEPIWNNKFIKSVRIVMKEEIGTQGRGGYFDGYGIIRDVMQNHLIQMLALVTMERPESLSAEHVRDEKVKVLQAVPEIKFSDVVIGQYVADKEGNNPGYKDDPGVPQDSVAPTFAQTILWVNNSRWHGVPFILKGAKAVEEKKAEIRIQFKIPDPELFPGVFPNELVIRVQPDEAIYFKIMNKEPGLSSNKVITDLDLIYSTKFSPRYTPDAYDRLILDAIRGDRSQFVRVDELAEAWRIFTPILHHIDGKNVSPHLYEFGSRGPVEADVQAITVGWHPYSFTVPV